VAQLAVPALALAGLAFAAPAASAADATLDRIGSFRGPTHVAAPPEDPNRVFVVERAGRIVVLSRDRRRTRPFLDIRSRVLSGGERGLLSLAFAPDYATSGRFYVYFTDRRGDVRVEEYRRSAGDEERADRGTRRTLIAQRHRRFPNHNGGQVAFGPDGLLYVSLGDGGGARDPLRSGQDLGSLLGKVLRIDPSAAGGRPYAIPDDNPFRSRRGARGEVYAYGLRNPYRMSFDRESGDIVIGDVGQSAIEEVDYAPEGGARGANYGWSVFEGRRRIRDGRAPGHVPPVLEQSHSSGWCAIIGGHVVRDPALSRLEGRYVYGDYCRRDLRSAVLREGSASGDRSVGVGVSELSSFGEDARGRVYVASLRGPVYRLRPP
jgi:glucose/arabinose dehydrogenase